MSAIAGAGALALSSGCIVTGDPGHEPPTRTAPRLLDPFPAPAEHIAVVRDSTSLGFAPLQFNADLISEDVDDNLEAVLLLDYGVLQGNQPWQDDVGESEILPATAAEVRKVRLQWLPRDSDADPENACHSITMLVTHAKFGTQPYTWCPKEAGDFDTITWFVMLCTGTLTDCFDDGGGPPDFSTCPLNGKDSAGNDLQYCPDDPAAALKELEQQP